MRYSSLSELYSIFITIVHAGHRHAVVVVKEAHAQVHDRDVGTGPTDPAAAGPKFHPQLKLNSCDQANKKFYCRIMHVNQVFAYRLNIILKNKATNLLGQQFWCKLGACKINYSSL